MISDFISIATVFLISALIGLTIVKVVEYRMTDISINMPTIKLPQQHITLRARSTSLLPQGQGEIVYTANPASVKPLAPAPTPGPIPGQSGGSATIVTGTAQTPGEVCANALNGSYCSKTHLVPECGKRMPNRLIMDPYRYESLSSAKAKAGAPVPDPSTVTGQQSYPAEYPRRKSLLTEPDPKPDYDGITYYQDPKKMTREQFVKFQHKAKFENMTVKDYQNWLFTFKDDPGRLTGFHRANLKVLIRGGKLVPSDMPRRTPVPPGVADQYTKMMHGQIHDDNISQPEFLGYQPHNYEEQVGHPSENKQNRNLRHLDFVNPDEPMKTWILTRN